MRVTRDKNGFIIQVQRFFFFLKYLNLAIMRCAFFFLITVWGYPFQNRLNYTCAFVFFFCEIVEFRSNAVCVFISAKFGKRPKSRDKSELKAIEFGTWRPRRGHKM